MLYSFSKCFFIFSISVRGDSIKPFCGSVSGKHFFIKGAKRARRFSASSMSDIVILIFDSAVFASSNSSFSQNTSSPEAILFSNGWFFICSQSAFSITIIPFSFDVMCIENSIYQKFYFSKYYKKRSIFLNSVTII